MKGNLSDPEHDIGDEAIHAIASQREGVAVDDVDDVDAPANTSASPTNSHTNFHSCPEATSPAARKAVGWAGCLNSVTMASIKTIDLREAKT